MVYVIINKIIDKKEEKHYKHVKCQSHLPGQKNTDEVQSKYSALINLLFCYHIYMYIYLTKNTVLFSGVCQRLTRYCYKREAKDTEEVDKKLAMQ